MTNVVLFAYRRGMAGEYRSEGLVEKMRSARLQAEALMHVFEIAGEEWEEPTITDLLLKTVHPLVTWTRFNRAEEGRWTGADWMWWWVDSDSREAFGALVQAKRLKRTPRGWKIDFSYRKGRQRQLLMDTADFYNIVPLYALYLGTSAFRAGDFCEPTRHSDDCLRCRQSTLSLVPAALTRSGIASASDTEIAMRFHQALETLVDPEIQPKGIWGSRSARFDDDFAAFLDEPQVGSRAIAKKIVRKMQERRMGEYAATATLKAELDVDGAVFSNVPDDHGHGGPSTYASTLPGLRRRLPAFVSGLLDGGVENPMGEWSTPLRWAGLDGIAVFHLL